MSATLNLTEVLSSLQDYLTKDGSISTEGRSFYTNFRNEINAHPGTFAPTEIEILMENARRHMTEEVSDEDFKGYVEAVISKISVKERLEIKAKEDADTRSKEEIARMVEEAEEEARAAAEAKAAAEEEAVTGPGEVHGYHLSPALHFQSRPGGSASGAVVGHASQSSRQRPRGFHHAGHRGGGGGPRQVSQRGPDAGRGLRHGHRGLSSHGGGGSLRDFNWRGSLDASEGGGGGVTRTE